MTKQASECDCCGRVGILARVWAFGIETFACAECRGEDGYPYGEEPTPAILQRAREIRYGDGCGAEEALRRATEGAREWEQSGDRR